MHNLSFLSVRKQVVCPYLLNEKLAHLIAFSLSCLKWPHQNSDLWVGTFCCARPRDMNIASCGDKFCWMKSSAGDSEGAKRWQEEAKVGGLLFKWLLKTVHSGKLTLALVHICPQARKVCSCMGDLWHKHSSSHCWWQHSCCHPLPAPLAACTACCLPLTSQRPKGDAGHPEPHGSGIGPKG